MSKGILIRVARVMVPPLMLAAAALWVVDELRFRGAAVQSMATVREFHAGGWADFGFGTAVADVEFNDAAFPTNDRPIRTALWYAPAEGDRLRVHYQLADGVGRVDDAWQSFLVPTVLAVIALGWYLHRWLNAPGDRDPYGLSSREELAPGRRTPGRH